jgi:hypothetical protein
VKIQTHAIIVSSNPASQLSPSTFRKPMGRVEICDVQKYDLAVVDFC